MNAFVLLAERKSAISTKNFKRAGIAFISFLQLLFNKFLNAVSFRFASVTLQRHGSDKLCECLTAGCKAFSLVNGKGMGTNDWVIRSLFYLKKKRNEEEVRSLEKISKNLLGSLKL
jgi:hypothetical protein